MQIELTNVLVRSPQFGIAGSRLDCRKDWAFYLYLRCHIVGTKFLLVAPLSYLWSAQ